MSSDKVLYVCTNSPPSSTTSFTLHHMLLLLYLNVVLKVNDVVLGCCFECSVRSALLRSQDIVMILHHILESQWTFHLCDSSFICQSASAICKFFCKSLHTCYVKLFSPPPLWTNCQYKRIIRIISAYSDGWLLASPVDCKPLRQLQMTVKLLTASLDFNTT